MTTQKILVTGASGLIGGLIVEHLAGKYEFTALNRRPVDGIPCTQADISDLDAILPAFEGVDMVVHMANYIDDVFDWEKHLSAGIIGTRNVFEAARIHGVGRVVYGSTGDTQTGLRVRQGPAVRTHRRGQVRRTARHVAYNYAPRPRSPEERLRRVQGLRRGPGPLLLRRVRHVDSLHPAGRRHAR